MCSCRRWHPKGGGAVGAVRVLQDKARLVSGAADGSVALWSGEGDLLALVDLGFQVTALSVGSVFVATGGARGELQMLLLAADEELQKEGVKPSAQEQAAAASKPESPGRRYELFFDSRPNRVGLKGVLGRVAEHSEAFEAFSGPARKPVSAAELLSAARAAGAGAAASREERERMAAEAKRKAQLAQMGEDRGVARSSGAVSLESNSSRAGRKCDNTSCLNREGLGVETFKRCSACKSVFYCSLHCQKTHFRDAHKAACARMAEEWKQCFKERAEQEKLERAEEERAAATAVAKGRKEGLAQSAQPASEKAETSPDAVSPVMSSLAIKETAVGPVPAPSANKPMFEGDLYDLD